MAVHEVQLIANPGIFDGLAKQNMLFHQCIGELVDNSIASCPNGEKFHLEIIFETISEENVRVYVADNSSGMDIETLKDALQLGKIPKKEQHRLHEHGFGLKNALATLTKNTHDWKIWTRQRGSNTVLSVNGPFGPTMKISDEDPFPKKEFLPADISTLAPIFAKFKPSYKYKNSY